jgi:5-methylthioadenosine/S-adenosylhomocysteine deaminase
MGEGIKTWIWGGTALVPDRANGVLEDSAIGIENGRIAFVGTRAEAKPPANARKIDASGCLVMPGLVNGHTHIGMSMLRGFADDMPFEPWLHSRILPTEKKFTGPEFTYWGSLLAACEMIRSGTTSFNDMYHFEFEAARAADEAGLRMVAGFHFDESMSHGGNREKRFSEMARLVDPFLEKVSSYPLVKPSIAPHALYSVSIDSWKCIIELAIARKVRIHSHLSETQKEVDDAQKAFGKTPVQVLGDLGLWEQKVTAAHMVCVTAEDIDLLGRHQVGISHNIESNLKLGTLVAPVVEMRRAGVRVALGTDSTASNNNLDLLAEADFAAKLQAFKYGPGTLKAEEIFSMLTAEGALAAGFGDEVGSIGLGKVADLIAVEVSGPHSVPLYNPYSHLVYTLTGRDVKHTVVNGEVLMENRNLQTLDEQEILREAASWARRISSFQFH